jgi:hypothetical protein
VIYGPEDIVARSPGQPPRDEPGSPLGNLVGDVAGTVADAARKALTSPIAAPGMILGQTQMVPIAPTQIANELTQKAVETATNLGQSVNTTSETVDNLAPILGPVVREVTNRVRNVAQGREGVVEEEDIQRARTGFDRIDDIAKQVAVITAENPQGVGRMVMDTQVGQAAKEALTTVWGGLPPHFQKTLEIIIKASAYPGRYPRHVLMENIIRASKDEDFVIPLAIPIPGDNNDIDLPDIPLGSDEELRGSIKVIRQVVEDRTGQDVEEVYRTQGSEAAFELATNALLPNNLFGLMLDVAIDAALDPFTYAGLGAIGSRRLATLARGRRASATTQRGSQLAGVAEKGANIAYRTLRAGEMAGDLYLPLAVKGLGKVWNRIPARTQQRIIRTAPQRVEREMEIATRALVDHQQQLGLKIDDVLPDAADGVPPPRPDVPTEDVRQTRRDVAATYEPPPEPNIRVGRSVRHSESVRITKVDDGYKVTTREPVDPNDPSAGTVDRRSDATFGSWAAAAEQAEIARILLNDRPLGVPGRFMPNPTRNRAIDEIYKAGDPDGIRRALESISDDLNIHEDVMRSLGRGQANADHALESSSINRQIMDAYRADTGRTIPDEQLPPLSRYEGNAASVEYRQMENVLSDPSWKSDVQNGNRAALYRSGTIRKEMPTAEVGTPEYDTQMAGVDRYVRMVEEYAARHPEALNDPQFADDFARAQNLSEQRGLKSYRRRARSGRRGRRQGAAGAAATQEQQAGGVANIPSGRRRRGAADVTGVASAQRADIDADEVTSRGNRVLERMERAEDPLETVTVELAEDIHLLDQRIPRGEVPGEWKELFPKAPRNRPWREGTVQDLREPDLRAKKADGTPIETYYAPDSDTLETLVLSDSDVQRLIGGAPVPETTAAPPPAAAATPPPTAAAPDLQTVAATPEAGAQAAFTGTAADPVNRTYRRSPQAVGIAQLTTNGRFSAPRTGPRALPGQPIGIVKDGLGMEYTRERFNARYVTKESKELVHTEKLLSGKTVLQRWAQLADGYQTDGIPVGNKGKTKKLGLVEAEARATKEVLAELQEALNKREGVRTPRARSAVARKTLNAYDTYLTLHRQRALGSWLNGFGYITSNLYGNSLNLGLGMKYRELMQLWNPRSILREYKMIRDEYAQAIARSKNPLQPNPWDTPGQNLARRMKSTVPQDVISSYQAQVPTGGDRAGRRTGTIPQRALGKIGLRPLGTILADQRAIDGAAAIDGLSREVLWVGHQYDALPNAIADFKISARDRLLRAGKTQAQAEEIIDRFARKHADGLFHGDNVIEHFREEMPPGQAIRLGRDWQNAYNTIRQQAGAEVDRVLLNFRPTRADELLSRIFFFHRFHVRQYGFILNQMMNHPALINAYMNYKEEMEEYLANNDLPWYVEGFIKTFTLPGGQALLVKPMALLAVGGFFADAADPDGDGKGFFDWVYQNPYLGINPLLRDALNITNLVDDNRPPDILTLANEANVAVVGINWARYLGLGDDSTPIGNGYRQLMRNAKEYVTENVPGLEPERAISEQSVTDSQLKMLITDEVRKQGYDINSTDPAEAREAERRINEAYLDPESDTYKEAQRRYLWGETAKAATRFLIRPFRPRVYGETSDGRLMTGDMVTDAEKSVASTTDPRTVKLRSQSDEYHTIGTPDSRIVVRTIDAIRGGYTTQVVEYAGETYTPEQIAAMTDDQRSALADALLFQYGLTDMYSRHKDQQDAFKADPANAEYAAYTEWSKAVRDYEGGPEAYWKEISDPDSDQYNPNAALWLETLEDLPEEQRERVLVGQNAYLNVIGAQPSSYDPEPEATGLSQQMIGDPSGATAPAVTAPATEATAEGEPVDYQTQVTEGVEEYATNLARFDAAVQQVLVSMGYNPGTPFNQLPPLYKEVVEAKLAEQGITPPRADGPAYYYLQWVAQQPQGVDISIEAYMAAEDAQYAAGSGQRFVQEMYPMTPEQQLQVIGTLAP